MDILDNDISIIEKEKFRLNSQIVKELDGIDNKGLLQNRANRPERFCSTPVIVN